MNEATTPSLILTETYTRVPGARPLSGHQPLQVIQEQEEEEDESSILLPNDYQTSPYAMGPSNQATPIVTILGEVLPPQETAHDIALGDFFTVEEEMNLSLPIPLPADGGARIFEHPLNTSGSSFISSSAHSLSRTMSTISFASMASTDTFLSRKLNQHDPTIPLSSLLNVISRHRSLQEARIVRADSYQKFNGRVVHRFIILELERDGRQKIWLRIDRRRDESPGLLSFVANGARAPSDDRAWLSTNKHLISEGLDAEHTTLFEGVPPTLGDLRWVFLAIVQVLKRYELFGANCWFMVSFIYECLDEIFHGSAVARFLYLRRGSEEVRREIRTAARLIITFPFEEVPLYLINQYGNIENFYNAMLGHHINTGNDTTTALARSLFDLRNAIPEWLPLQTFIRFSDHNPLDKIPPNLGKTVLRLAQLFDGGNLTGDAPRWQSTFMSFLMNSSRHSLFAIQLSPPKISRLRATICLEIMNKELQFNICKHPSSFLRNQTVPNVGSLKKTYISSHLRYVCYHWANEISQLETLDSDLLGILSQFLQTHFLHWLEVMSALSFSPVKALENLDAARIPLSSKELANMIEDAQQFVETFEVPILESVPHIYISALAFTPLSSKLFSNLRGLLRQTAVIRAEARSSWFTLRPIINPAPDRSVLSLAFSPDGRFLVSGSTNTTLQLWDAQTREAIGEPLRGHDHWVLSVVFSPDGTRIASSSADSTIRLWDVATRRPIGQPLRGHMGFVASVAFSPDGAQLVSGSWDKTIGRWDARTGSKIGMSLRGYSHRVGSVVFSPDGHSIASASSDNMIRIWDTETGKPIGKPVEGHEGAVRYVAFSPNGAQIASASADCTVRRWDARTGEAIGKPSRGHDSRVYCVVYSPDGRWIASGSGDKTVRVWNACTGEAVGEPLAMHSHRVRTVAFSPDGNTLASGGYDGTIWLRRCNFGGSETQPELSSPPSHVPQTPGPQEKPIVLHPPSQIQQDAPSSHLTYPTNLPPRTALRLGQDGWILGPNDELILWLPFGLRSRVPFSEREVIDTIDFTEFKCATEWTECWHEVEAV